MKRDADRAATQPARRRFCAGLLGAATVACAGRSSHAQQAPDVRDIAVEDIGRIRVVTGSGGNIVSLAGTEGRLVVDGGLAVNADRTLDALLRPGDRIDTLINTHWHPQQIGLNVYAGENGATLIAQEKTAMYLRNRVTSSLFEGEQQAMAPAGIPGHLVRLEETIRFDGLAVELGYLPAAHTDGDLYVHFPTLDTVAVGGVVAGDRWARVDYRNGAWFGGRVRALEWLASLTSDDTTVIPAEGPVLKGRDLTRQRDICTDLFNTMIGYMNRGFGPEDAVASQPLAPFESEFGDASVFIEEAYRSMLIAYVPD